MELLEEILGRHDIDTTSLKPWNNGYSLVIPCRDAVSTWLKLRSLVPSTGLWPVLSDPQDLEEIAYGKTLDQRTVEQIIEAAESIEVPEWFRSRQREHLDHLETGLRNEKESCERSGRDAEASFVSWFEDMIAHEGFPRGPWTEDHGPRELHTYLTQSWRKLTELAVVLVPAVESWHVPAHLYLGNWNECPAPEEHVAILEYWYRRHEAEVMTITHDVVETRVGSPPQSRDEALALAKEQYLHCSDIVEQGTNTIDRLAVELLQSPVWFFWWD